MWAELETAKLASSGLSEVTFNPSKKIAKESNRTHARKFACTKKCSSLNVEMSKFWWSLIDIVIRFNMQQMCTESIPIVRRLCRF